MPGVTGRTLSAAGSPRPRASSRAPGGASPGPLRTPAKPPRPVGGRPGRFTLAWRRQRRLVRPALWSLLAVVLLGTGASLVRSTRPDSSIASWREKLGGAIGLTVQDVVFEGREKTPEPMLRAALGVSRGDKLLGFSLEAARARVEKLDWVQTATVERRLPGTVVVTLRERQPFAVWQIDPQHFELIDRKGQPVARQDPAKDTVAFTTLPLVVGPGAPETAATLLDQLATYPAIRSHVVAAVRVGGRRWNLHLAGGGDVMLPEGAEPGALARLQELQANQQLLDRPLAVIDMRLPEKLVVRPQPEPRPPPATTPRRPT